MGRAKFRVQVQLERAHETLAAQQVVAVGGYFDLELVRLASRVLRVRRRLQRA